ncbi:hypothetical protein [Paenibacillus cremeus]|uniref:Uncharacterized protein n=1 Tax=Paenibacillus cremeus TaxID=2163881 RepID=A0A559JVN2_9BACL|nr:hypothetical protein [Paenibacillus cremeus]TVY03951.1 hypothetical protein FPZ49_30980 [Paenibacillus cremeus]
MLIPLPTKFDQNELLVIGFLIILILLLWLLPKRFPTSVTILILSFSIGISRIVDHSLAGPQIDFYDVMDTGDYELFDFFCYILYAPFAYVFVYLYDKWNIRGMYILLYITACSFVGIVFEWFTTTPYIHFFIYKQWSILYSFPIYLFIQSCTLLFYHVLKRIYYKTATIS